jgi:Uma2 family endonuclease
MVKNTHIKHTYHSDFYDKERNLIIEIKNSYLYERDYNEIKAKEKYTKESGFEYIIIIDKNYDNLNSILKII